MDLRGKVTDGALALLWLPMFALWLWWGLHDGAPTWACWIMSVLNFLGLGCAVARVLTPKPATRGGVRSMREPE